MNCVNFIVMYLDKENNKITKEFETLDEAYAFAKTLNKNTHFAIYNLAE